MVPLSLALLALVQVPPQESLGPGKQLKVLYAGATGDERMDRFLEFLEPWFAQVEAIDLQQLDAKSAAPYDVVIADWKRQYRNGTPLEGVDAPGKLDASFGKPVILIGATAGTIQHHSKIDWL